MAGFFVSVFVGCAQPRGELFPAIRPPIIWPSPPEQPRIRLVGKIAGSEDLRAAVSGGEAFKAVLHGPRPPIRFTSPHSVAISLGGLLAVADGPASAVHILDLEARTHHVVTGWSGGAFKTPIGAAWIGSRLFVTDAELHQVFELSTTGIMKQRFGESELKRPVGLTFVAERNQLYVVDGASHDVAVYDTSGQLVSRFGGNGSEPGRFNYPTHISTDGKGRLVIADTGNFRVQILDLDGQCIHSLGKKGDGAGDLSLPKGVAFDRDGHLYVVDAHFENVQIFDDSGQLLLAFGQEGNKLGEFALPAGLAIDAANRIWVADSANRRIQVFERLGTTG